MPDKLHRHFTLIGVSIYVVALITVSLLFRNYALKPIWMVWGVGTVVLFFGMTYGCFKSWRNDAPKTFMKKAFWIALGMRVIYVVGIIYYYHTMTGVPMEFGAADSLNYHQTASYLSQLAKEGYFKAIFEQLDAKTMGFSDQGYLLYLTSIYTVF